MYSVIIYIFATMNTINIMRKDFFKKRVITLAVILGTFSLQAQTVAPKYQQPESYEKAIELYQAANYGASCKLFTDLKKDIPAEDPINFDIDYYRLMCQVKQNKKSAESEISTYLDQVSGSPWENQLRFEMARLQFYNKKYKAAAKTFSAVESSHLKGSDIDDYKFYNAYCNFESGNLKKAAQGFYEVKRGNSIYAPSASYYWGYINYSEGNYETALEEFKKIADNKQFSSFISYYTIQIYYIQEKYDKVVEMADNVLVSAPADQKNELNKIIGDSYFELGQYVRAIQYLEDYTGQKGKLTREEYYRIGHCYSYISEYQKAVNAFDKATLKKDTLSQNAYYRMADCFLKMGDKNKARAAFQSASQSSFNPKIEEDALFNFAKLTYELSYSPFNETIKAFDEYISKYPDSERNDAAFDYLVKVYMTTKNYKDAISSIEKIKVKSPSVKEALQRVTYYRGLELFIDGKYSDAITQFTKSLENDSYNRTYKSQSMYWCGEASYRMGKYSQAIKYFTDFQATPGSFSLPEFGNAYYNIGYCYFNQKQYDQASSWFRKYLNYSKTDPKMKADATNRIGDMYYMGRDYTEAIKFYNTSINMNVYDADYALFQRAKSYGVMSNNDSKIADLENFIKKYQKSAYTDDAYFELGRTYERVNNSDMAITVYKNLIKQMPQSSFVKQAHLQLGLIYYNRNDNKSSNEHYQLVVENYPNTEESEAALEGIKNNYVDMNDVDGFFKYTKSLGSKAGSVATDSEQDQTYYMAAEKCYMAGASNAAQQFEEYLAKFPNGIYRTNATYYLAETYYSKKEFSKSLKLFEEVVSTGDNIFTEPALIKVGELTFNAGKYDEALAYFLRLDKLANTQWNRIKARAGVMRCQYQLQNWNEAISAASTLLETEKITEMMTREANLKLANSYINIGKTDEAMNYYTLLAEDTKSLEGAEAKYKKAKIYFDNKELEKSETEILDFIEKNTQHQYWLAKSFILLSDVYMGRNDVFQAKHTLKSLVDNYSATDDGIIDEAKEKLNILEAKENESIDNRSDEEKKDSIE